MAFTKLSEMDQSVRARSGIERKIVSSLVKELLKAELELMVDDGEGGDAIWLTNYKKIMEALNTVDEERLYVRIPGQKLAKGWIYLVYGNDGWDVISDNTVNLDEYIGRTQKLVDEEYEKWCSK